MPKKSGKLVPKKIQVTRNGRTFEQTVLVDPNKDDTPKQKPKKQEEPKEPKQSKEEEQSEKKEKKKEDKKDDTPKVKKNGSKRVKMESHEARTRIMSVSKQFENDDLMRMVKNSGVSFSRSPNKGVNRMRALMALKVHLEAGREFTEMSPQEIKSEKNEEALDKKYAKVNKYIEENIEDEGYQFTDNPEEAIYILTNGKMIDGMFDYGSRGEDHRMIEAFTKKDRYDDGFWDEVHLDMGLVRLVPETYVALVRQGQRISDEQKAILEEVGYDIEEY